MLNETFPNFVSDVALVNLRLIPESMTIPISLSYFANSAVHGNMLDIDRRVNEFRGESLKLFRRVNVEVATHASGHGDAANPQRLINNLLNNIKGENCRNTLMNPLAILAFRHAEAKP
jgi:hypothetical protein